MHRIVKKIMLRLCSAYIFLYFLVEVSSLKTLTEESIVKLPDGEIRGTVETYERMQISVYRGIPYAKPPVGPLRLNDPEKPERWPSTLDATKFKSKCPQLDMNNNTIGEEDCLFINVFTPFIQGRSAPTVTFPVMVFIHGGNFNRGSADVYTSERFAGNNVILVTFNYRIGVLGFLSTGDDACPGNLGLKDQLLALQWVRENIQVFGGDTGSITLFGQGAGAESVFLHILSPKSTGLFHRAITQSGSPLCERALEEEPYDYAVKIARRLKCSTKSTKTMIDCIRDRPLRDVLDAQKYDMSFGGLSPRTIPVVDKNGFLPDTPEKLLGAGDFKPIPLVSGVNQDDGTILYPMIISQEENLKKNSSFLLKELIPQFLLTATNIRENIESVSQAIYFHYFHGVDPRNFTQVLQPFINMTTDALFVSCNFKTLELYSARGARTYMYTFQYKGKNSMLDVELGRDVNYNGVSHGDELLYLFDINTFEKTSSIDDKMKNDIPFMWTKFAKTGEAPTVLNLEPYTSEFKYYLEINETQAVKTSFRHKEVDLWLDYLPILSEIKPSGYQDQYKTGGFGWAMMAIAIILFIVAVVLSVMLLRKSKSHYFGTTTEEK